MKESYESAIKNLFERHPSVQNAGFGAAAYKPGLEAMREFCSRLGDPFKAYKTIHVAGTNGKGSVCSYIAASLAGCGYKTGLYTSPHLNDFRERIKIISSEGFSLIPKEDVLEFLELPPGDLSFFEITTAMAFWYFQKAGVDYAVIEVGLGGRLDSTNIITPVVSAVTSIGLDHCALLGNTRALIAGEKAGIFKGGVPAVVWGHDPETDPVFERAASSAGCPLIYAPCNGPETATDLEGPCQRENVSTAVCALRAAHIDPCIPAIRHAGALTGLHARWERMETGGKTVICDIGHNPPALRENFARLRGQHATIVYGIMADKDLEGIAPYFPLDADCILCAPGTARAMNVDELHKRLHAARPDLPLHDAPSVEQAVLMALSMENDTVYIGGSTFVVAEFYEIQDKLVI